MIIKGEGLRGKECKIINLVRLLLVFFQCQVVLSPILIPRFSFHVCSGSGRVVRSGVVAPVGLIHSEYCVYAFQIAMNSIWHWRSKLT